ncbi:MAG: T9SS type A sorting domain-containing protein [Saprospiraceae bacterium]|nr:T9SS type A sorting domain-containing protein [Saprospiraceae bacterium]
MNKIQALILLVWLCTGELYSQTDWVTKQYQVDISKDLPYGEALDFAGTMRTLYLDLAQPVNDTPPTCGRPLVMIIHGGAWLGGDKGEGYPAQLLNDFAARGYVAASINYRLGMFQTEKFINCNISVLPGNPWNCLNVTDSLEWTRAWYRAVQDGKGALRYLVSQSGNLSIDRRNVYVIGESAGAFTALGVVYLDDGAEKPGSCQTISDVPKPNNLYETPCIVNPGFAVAIDSMDLSRPDLGAIHGSLHLDAAPYSIKACGDIYGGLFTDLFSMNHYAEIPALYLYHQPADLIVPINYQRILAGISACASSLGGCQAIYGRPHSSGSVTVVALLDSLDAAGKPIPDFQYDQSTNNASCLEQVLNPALTGHSLDNYTLRTTSMATFFASHMDQSSDCLTATNNDFNNGTSVIKMYPNPVTDKLFLENASEGTTYRIIDPLGKVLLTGILINSSLDVQLIPAGIYYIQLMRGNQLVTNVFMKIGN